MAILSSPSSPNPSTSAPVVASRRHARQRHHRHRRESPPLLHLPRPGLHELTFRSIEVDSRLIPVQMSIIAIEPPRGQADGKRRKDVKVDEGQVVQEKHDIKGDIIGATIGTGGGSLVGAIFGNVAPRLRLRLGRQRRLHHGAQGQGTRSPRANGNARPHGQHHHRAGHHRHQHRYSRNR